MRAALLVNPMAGRGRAGRRAPEIAALLREVAGDDIAIHVTEEPGHAVQIAREVARADVPVLFVLGGDGTVHEAVNGLVDPLGGAVSRTILAPLGGGTGNDALRSLAPHADDVELVHRAMAGHARLVDVGRVRFLRLEWGADELGALPVRLFLNAANIGIAASVAARVNADATRVLAPPRTFAFPWAMVSELARGPRSTFTLHVDGTPPRTCAGWNLAFANGRYFGGGIPIAPHATIDDGVLDVILFGAASRLRACADLPRLRAGTHLTLPYVTHEQAHAIHVRTDESQMVEADGEWIGETPCSIDLLPRALRVVA